MIELPDYQNEVERISDDYGLTMRITCHIAPVQAEGNIGDKAFYFRSRWDTAYFGVADTVDNAVMNAEFSYETGGDSTLTPEEFEAIMREALSAYLAWQITRL